MSIELPPGPRWPSLVTMAKMSMDPYGFFATLKAKYGDVFTLRQPGLPPGVFVCDPEGVRALCTGGYEDFSRMAETIKFLLGDHALIFQQNGQHKETRKLMAPPFYGERMRAYGGDMAEIADATIDRWRDGERRLLHKDFQDIALKVILRSVFGMSEGPLMTELARLFVAYLDSILTPWFYAATLVLSGARVRDFLRSRGLDKRGILSHLKPLQTLADRVARIDEILFNEIAACRALPEAERARRSDILAMLVAARFDDGSAMTDEMLRDQLMILLIGGHETTATSLSWAIMCALQNPGTVEKMRAEVQATFGDGFDPARVKQLAYVGAVASESMRLYPIATAVTRKLSHDMTIAGRVIPKGTFVSPCICLVQRDARVWEDPLAFRPERFVANKASVSPHNGLPVRVSLRRAAHVAPTAVAAAARADSHPSAG
jgi:cytochrome P450